MNKKGMEIRTVAVILLLIFSAFILIVLFFGGPNGLLNKAAKSSLSFAEEYLGKIEKNKDFSKEKSECSEISKNMFKYLEFVFKEAKESENEGCFLETIWIPNEDLRRCYVEILGYEDKSLILLKNRKGKIIESVEIEGVKPCVVGGDKEGVKDFFCKYLRYYNDIIYYDCRNYEGRDWFNEKVSKISIQRTDRIDTNIGRYDIEIGNNKFLVFYKPNKDYLCFIPTIDRGVYSEKGVKDERILNNLYSYGDGFFNLKKDLICK